MEDITRDALLVLCGEKLPFETNPDQFIRDRSVPHSDRFLAIAYLESIIESIARDSGCTLKLFRQEWTETHNGKEVPFMNLIVRFAGSVQPDHCIVVGAHYDVQNSLSLCWRGTDEPYTVTPGADDNTSGVVGCLAIIHHLSHHHRAPSKTVDVLFFDGEEPGLYCNLAVGSEYYVRSRKDEVKIEFALIADMIGAHAKEGLVYSLGKQVDPLEWSILFDERNIEVAQYGAPWNCSKVTDTASFMSEGIATALISNCAGFDAVPSFYHTENDAPGIIDWTTLFSAIDTMALIVNHLLQKKLTPHLVIGAAR
eukprot:TRINITY_DN17467_c0_g1_i1.p1 TRINITY_DN17467_c0_g1~~TRINITY_DN17467_c0_g1_i1.p1  ORF type:complete len:311 (+),score=49.02 TRINITY_DN17467_c0_g1_i1:280-1212(+)